MSSTDNNQDPASLPLSPSRRTKAKHISDLVSGILDDVIARRSGMTLDLLTAWDEVVGPDYCACTRPEKIQWPRRASETDSFEPGTLIVACDDAKAVFFQHETTQLLERLNFFFGFQAIAKIKINQKPVLKPASKRTGSASLKLDEENRLQQTLKQIEDPELRQRLEKFGRGVIKRNKSAKP